jgi:hypothetical protein
MLAAALLTAACTTLTTLLFLHVRGATAALDANGQVLRRAAIYHQEGARFMESRKLLANVGSTAEATVEGGTALVRAVHHGIAAIPFSILEAIPATRDTTRVVRTIHDLAADSVYSAISAINRVFGKSVRKPVEPKDR